jgi:hypothetical protein
MFNKRVACLGGGILLPSLLLIAGCDAPPSRPPIEPLTKEQAADLDRATADLIKAAGSAPQRFQFLERDGYIIKGDTMTGEIWVWGHANGTPGRWVKLPETR